MKKPMIVIATVIVIATMFTGCGKKTTEDNVTTNKASVETENQNDTQTKADNSVTKTDKTEAATISSNNDENGSTDSSPAKSDDNTSAATESAETAHSHNWAAITEKVTVTDSPATTKQELVSAAYDEIVMVTKYGVTVTQFNYDDYRPTSSDDSIAHARELMNAGLDCSYHTEDIEISKEEYDDYVARGSNGTYCYDDEIYVHHDAVYKTVDVPAKTHTEERVVGYKCSCGATK